MKVIYLLPTYQSRFFFQNRHHITIPNLLTSFYRNTLPYTILFFLIKIGPHHMPQVKLKASRFVSDCSFLLEAVQCYLNCVIVQLHAQCIILIHQNETQGFRFGSHTFDVISNFAQSLCFQNQLPSSLSKTSTCALRYSTTYFTEVGRMYVTTFVFFFLIQESDLDDTIESGDPVHKPLINFLINPKDLHKAGIPE